MAAPISTGMGKLRTFLLGLLVVLVGIAVFAVPAPRASAEDSAPASDPAPVDHDHEDPALVVSDDGKVCLVVAVDDCPVSGRCAAIPR